MTETTISADEFQALEQKVLRAVEVVRRERELRAAAESEVATLRELLDHQAAESNEAQTEAQAKIASLTQERETVRGRVEKMLTQIDEMLEG